MASAKNRGSPSYILNSDFRPSIRDSTLLENYFKYVFTKSDITNKTIVSTGDINVNLLDFNISEKVQSFVNA